MLALQMMTLGWQIDSLQVQYMCQLLPGDCMHLPEMKVQTAKELNGICFGESDRCGAEEMLSICVRPCVTALAGPTAAAAAMTALKQLEHGLVQHNPAHYWRK